VSRVREGEELLSEMLLTEGDHRLDWYERASIFCLPA
jgi:hypothetical protein